MTKKNNAEETQTKEALATEEKKVEQFKYGIAPSLIINMVKGSRVYRFEMPIGAHLSECEEACKECLKLTQTMLKEAEEKQAKAEQEAAEKEESDKTKEVTDTEKEDGESESNDEDSW